MPTSTIMTPASLVRPPTQEEPRPLPDRTSTAPPASLTHVSDHPTTGLSQSASTVDERVEQLIQMNVQSMSKGDRKPFVLEMITLMTTVSSIMIDPTTLSLLPPPPLLLLLLGTPTPTPTAAVAAAATTTT